MSVNSTQSAGRGNSVPDSESEIDAATKKLQQLIQKATLAQLKSASEILPAKAIQSAVQGLPKQ